MGLTEPSRHVGDAIYLALLVTHACDLVGKRICLTSLYSADSVIKLITHRVERNRCGNDRKTVYKRDLADLCNLLLMIKMTTVHCPIIRFLQKLPCIKSSNT